MKKSIILCFILINLSYAQKDFDLNKNAQVPKNFTKTLFSDASLAPCPAAICVAPTGEVFVGVDPMGSLGKDDNKGKIIRLVDTDNDGKADKSTLFCKVDHPRGLFYMNNKLYVLHPPHFSVYTDTNNDGVADSKELLIENISTKQTHERGADHTTNGIRLGIDGWFYIAVGDFGFVNATTRDGKKHTLLGGGIVRVRPDGTDLEIYVTGLRNIYDVAIDPKLNIFTRDNTNDGKGWNVRFNDNIQSGYYGYPRHYKNYINEMLPALKDFGGGSGTGSMFLQEPTWPKEYNNVPLTGDWGTSQVYLHRLTKNGSSFTQKQEEFIKIAKFTDLDVDGSGRMYLASWLGNGYKGGSAGAVVRVTPPNWQYKQFKAVEKRTLQELYQGLRSSSAILRIYSQQELLKRHKKQQLNKQELHKIIFDKKSTIDSRIAALFTYKQAYKASANATIIKLVDDKNMEEFALRALADRTNEVKNVPLSVFEKGLQSKNERSQIAAIIALGRTGNKKAADLLFKHVKGPKTNFIFKKVKALNSASVKKNKSKLLSVKIKNKKELYILGKSDGNPVTMSLFDATATVNGKKTILSSLIKDNKTIDFSKIKVTSKKDKNKKPSLGYQFTDTELLVKIILPKNTTNFSINVKTASGKKGGLSAEYSIYEEKPDLTQSLSNSTPNSRIIPSHVAIQALIALKATQQCVDNLDNSLAIGAMKYMHDLKMVEALIKKLPSLSKYNKQQVLGVLIRLYHKETVQNDRYWWHTKPRDNGPYDRPIKWEGSPLIQRAWNNANEGAFVKKVLDKDNINNTGEIIVKIPADVKGTLRQKHGLGEVLQNYNKKDFFDKVNTAGSDLKLGREVFEQACLSCHQGTPKDDLRGPPLYLVMGVMNNKETLLDHIMKPNDQVSQGFPSKTFTLSDGSTLRGTIIASEKEYYVILDSSGAKKTIIKNKIPGKKYPVNRFLKTGTTPKGDDMSVMPPALMFGYSLKELNSLLDYIIKENK